MQISYWSQTFAARRSRSEGRAFVAGYCLYKLLYRVLTGKTINFGNFSVVPAFRLGALVRLPDIWSHYAATIVKSRIPHRAYPVDRGTRYDGESKMNLSSLVSHGMAAVSVHLDTVLSRFILLSVSTAVLGFLALLVVVALRFSVNPFPVGFATTATLIIILIVFLVLSVSLVLSLMFHGLAFKHQFSPLKVYRDYLETMDT